VPLSCRTARRNGHTTCSEPGCRCYDLFITEAYSADFVLLERYEDGPAGKAHRASAHYQAYRARLPDLLAKPTGCTGVVCLAGAAGARHEPDGCRPGREVLRHGIDIGHKTFYNVYS
jgi:quinol monooxygenase YgiN